MSSWYKQLVKIKLRNIFSDKYLCFSIANEAPKNVMQLN